MLADQRPIAPGGGGGAGTDNAAPMTLYVSPNIATKRSVAPSAATRFPFGGDTHGAITSRIRAASRNRTNQWSMTKLRNIKDFGPGGSIATRSRYELCM